MPNTEFRYAELETLRRAVCAWPHIDGRAVMRYGIASVKVRTVCRKYSHPDAFGAISNWIFPSILCINEIQTSRPHWLGRRHSR